MRFLLDENIPGAVADLLRAAGHDVLEIAASTLRGSPDADLCRLATDEERVLVTRDLDFPIPAAFGRPPGLVILRPGPNARAVQIEQMVRTLVEQVDLVTLTGAVTILEPGRCRQRTYDKLSW